MTRLSLVLQQLDGTRRYTLHLLEDIPQSDWFLIPAGSVSHVGWQVGHLAMAEYRLTLHRIRGVKDSDDEIISADMLKRYGRESVPDPSPEANDSPQELLAALNRVHDAVHRELPAVTDEELDLPPLVAHKLFDTRYGSLVWCSLHEMLHVGQIGLLRRMLGMPPQW